jgi:hypothetical protein
MNKSDFVGFPCGCGECVQAGVSNREQRRDPHTGKWLHGYALKRWYESRDRFQQLARAAAGKPGRHAAGFEKLVQP